MSSPAARSGAWPSPACWPWKPGTLVLDEPAAGLDPAGPARNMLNLIQGIHESGVTVVMVSHSMDDAARLCDRLIVLNHGQIAFRRGTPAKVFRHAGELRGHGAGRARVRQAGQCAAGRAAIGIPQDVSQRRRMAEA